MGMPFVRFVALQKLRFKQEIEARNRATREQWQADNAHEH